MYEELGNLKCSKVSIKDIVKIYNFISPFIKDADERKVLKKYLRYYLRLGFVCIVEDSDNILGVYAGKDNHVHYIACKSSPKAALLLFYVVFCGIHNKYKDSTFKAFDYNINIFEKIRTPEGKACIIDSDGLGTINTKTKKYIELLFRRFKNE